MSTAHLSLLLIFSLNLPIAKYIHCMFIQIGFLSFYFVWYDVALFRGSKDFYFLLCVWLLVFTLICFVLFFQYIFYFISTFNLQQLFYFNRMISSIYVKIVEFFS